MLQIADPWERVAVAAADTGLRAIAALRRRRARPEVSRVRRVLVLRLERIGDLLMSLPALYALRERVPSAAIDLVVGSWNQELARLIAGIDSVESMDATWLARGAGGQGWASLARQARGWRSRRYDLAVNLEGDIRSNMLLGLAGAAWTAGFGMAGGGPLLDDCVPFDPRSHTAVNGVRLVSAALGERVGDDAPMEGRDAASRLPRSALTIPASATAEAGRLLSRADARPDGAPLVGLHVGAGRAIKEWPVARMAEIGSWAARELGAALVLTGGRGDQAAAQRLQDALAPAAVINLAGAAGLLPLAAVLSRLVLFVTPDTGPMHLAATVGTPLVAVFGPSSPDRWGPLSRRCAVVRIDLPCSPCNRIRDPPARCLGHTPDCLEGIAAGRVIEAAKSVLRAEGIEDGDGSR